MSVWKRLQASAIAKGSAEKRGEARSREDLRIDAMGSGSDYSPFLQHNGVASLNLGFQGEDQDGIYHSIYDDFYNYTKFLDTDFVYGRALAQVMGTAVIRMASAEVLPFEFTDLADTAAVYVKELQSLLKQRQEEVRERNHQLEEGVFEIIRDPRRPEVAPPREEEPPSINFAPLENAVRTLSVSAERYGKALAAAKPYLSAHPEVVKSVNARLIQSERQMLDSAGLPQREWYRHLVYAPGFYTGYGVKTLPGVREGIEQKKYKEAEEEVVRGGASAQSGGATYSGGNCRSGICSQKASVRGKPKPSASGRLACLEILNIEQGISK